MSLFNWFSTKGFVFVFVVLLLCVNVPATFGAELNVPVVAGTQGEVVKLPVTVDKVEKLAGIKVALVYDQNILKYVKAGKTKYTANMLHVVNDKVPGKLIVVMAAAKGFDGENAPIVEMEFELLKDVKKEDKITLKITEAELMNDKLQKIEVKLK